jgi:hypothetical protein
MAMPLATPTAMFTAPLAWAAVRATPVVSAVGAPDGVFRFGGPNDGYVRAYTLLKTVDGVTTWQDVLAVVSYADRSRQPAQRGDIASWHTTAARSRRSRRR